MRSSLLIGCALGAAGLLLTLGPACEATAQTADAMRYSAAVEEAWKARWPGAEVVGFKKKVKQTASFWKLDLEEGDRSWQASFTDEGKLLSIEEIIDAASLPDPVQKAVEWHFPDAAITEVKRETIGDGKSPKVVYEVETGKGQVTVDPKGNVLKVR